ncbi:MAG TPA: substrate-binding domain-containing protein, partial [Clostridium sp.]
NTMNIICESFKNIKFPIAVFACNDLMAFGVMNACKKMGYQVPNQVSVIGFDNIAISNLVEPKLTTVDQNMYLLGENASRMLLDIIEKNNEKLQRKILNTKLIIRNSCAKIID